MDSVSLRIIKTVAREREMPLCNVVAMLPKRFRDHKDFYTLTSLIVRGYLDMPVEPPLRDKNEMELAIDLYARAVSPGGEFKYLDVTINGEDSRTYKVFSTAKTDFLLDDLRNKRVERLWAWSIAVVAALISAYLSARFEKKFDSRDGSTPLASSNHIR